MNSVIEIGLWSINKRSNWCKDALYRVPPFPVRAARFIRFCSISLRPALGSLVTTVVGVVSTAGGAGVATPKVTVMIVIFTSMMVACHQIHQKIVIRIFTMVTDTVTPCLSVAQDFRSSSREDRPLISLRIPVVSVAEASSRSPAADVAVLVAEVLNLSQASPRLVQPAPSVVLFALSEAKSRDEGTFPSSPGPLSKPDAFKAFDMAGFSGAAFRGVSTLSCFVVSARSLAPPHFVLSLQESIPSAAFASAFLQVPTACLQAFFRSKAL